MYIKMAYIHVYQNGKPYTNLNVPWHELFSPSLHKFVHRSIATHHYSSDVTVKLPSNFIQMIYPLVNVHIAMENHNLLVGKSTISMSIFQFANC